MTDLEQQSWEEYARRRTMEYLRPSLKNNWTTGIIRDELELLDSLSTGRRRAPNYVTESETQREYKNPKLRSVQYLRHIEQNRYGRYAYSPTPNPPRGAVPTFNDRPYPEVIPRFHLAKMPF